MGGFVLSGFISDHNSLTFLSVVVGEGGGVCPSLLPEFYGILTGIYSYGVKTTILLIKQFLDLFFESYSETLSCV